MFDTKSKEQIRQRLETAGARFTGDKACTCPFHRDSNPSAGLYQSENGTWRFKCQVCDSMNLDVIGIEARLTGMTAEEVIKSSGEDREQKSVIPESDIRSRYSKENGWKYLHEYTDTKGNITHLVACKYEGGKKKFLQMKRYGFNFVMGNMGKRPLFRLHKIKDLEKVVIVEGEKCVLALEHIGINNSTTCMGGAKSVSSADLTPLKGKRVIIWPDNDIPGLEYAKELKTALEAIDCKVGIVDLVPLILDDGGDVADIVAQHIKDYSIEEIREDIQGTIDDTKIDGYWETFNNGKIADLRSGVLKSIDVGWDCLAKTKWLIGGSVTTICAEPGIGKTWFVHDLAIRASRQGVKVANIQLEEDKDYHVSRLMTSLLGVRFTDPDEVNEEHFRILEKNKDLVDEISGMIICPDFDKCTLVNVASLVREKAEQGCKLIIVDSVSVAEKSKESWADDQRFINIVKHEVKKHKIRLILVTHPNALNGKTPTMDNLSGGKSYQRLSQVVLWLSANSKELNAWTGQQDAFEGTQRKGNRVITMLKGRNAHEHLPSNSFLFDFSNGQFHEVGFCDNA